MRINQINKIEKMHGIAINIFGYKAKEAYPLYVSKEGINNRADLLLLEGDGKNHYCLIKDFNRLMLYKTKYKGKKHFCKTCLQCFRSSRVLEKHVEDCVMINGTQAVIMPKEGKNIMEFKNIQKQLNVPFVVYADFECILEKVSEEIKGGDDGESYTRAYQKHIPCGFGYKTVCCYDNKYSEPVKEFRGKNAAKRFVNEIMVEAERCAKLIKESHNKTLIMTKEDLENFESSLKCCICDGEWDVERVVKDYCRISGKYRGPPINNVQRNISSLEKYL